MSSQVAALMRGAHQSPPIAKMIKYTRPNSTFSDSNVFRLDLSDSPFSDSTLNIWPKRTLAYIGVTTISKTSTQQAAQTQRWKKGLYKKLFNKDKCFALCVELRRVTTPMEWLEFPGHCLTWDAIYPNTLAEKKYAVHYFARTVRALTYIYFLNAHGICISINSCVILLYCWSASRRHYSWWFLRSVS